MLTILGASVAACVVSGQYGEIQRQLVSCGPHMSSHVTRRGHDEAGGAEGHKPPIEMHLCHPPTPFPNVHSLYMWVDCLTVNLGLHSLCPPTSWEVLNPRSQAFIWRRTILSYSLLWELDFEILWVIFREYWDPKLCIKAWSCYAILNSLFLNKWYLVKSQLWQ